MKQGNESMEVNLTILEIQRTALAAQLSILNLATTIGKPINVDRNLSMLLSLNNQEC
jgi:hypothetical protein